MTIFYPDVSHYNVVDVAVGTVALCAKGTHGTALVDSGYSKFKGQCTDKGVFFFAFHWLNHGNVTAQAQFAYRLMGTVPIMIDAEDVSGNTGYNGPLTVADIVGFVQAYRQLGGIVHLVYLPHWYWQDHMGSPDLSVFNQMGLFLVSSNYTAYSDNGPGWNSYGGVSPVIWQYTDKRAYDKGTTDFNAYKGSLDQFKALVLSGGEMEQSDKVAGNLSRGNTIGDVFADLSNLRDDLYLPVGQPSKNGAPPSSKLGVIVAAAETIEQGQLHVEMSLSDGDKQEIANMVISGLATVLEGLLHTAEGTK